MSPSTMHVIGILLLVFVTCTMGQNSTNNSNNTDQTAPPPTTPPTTPKGKNPIFGFDCRRGDGSCGTGTCDLNTGACHCAKGNSSYNCTDISTDTSTCSPACENNGTCHGGKCVCTENFYGTNCNLTRAQVLCKGEKMLVNINPIDNFDGIIYIKGNTSCAFSNASSTGAVDFQSELQKYVGIEGRWIVLAFTGDSCGNATVRTDGGQTAFVFTIYVQYVSLFKSAVDQIVVAECLVSNGTANVSSGDVSSVTDSDSSLDQVNADGKVDAVTLKVLSSDKKTVAKSVTLGDEIHLVFSMPLSAGSTYTSFRLLLCVANNTVLEPELKSLIFLQNGCPTQIGKSIFSGLPEQTTTATDVTIDIKLKAFMFVGPSTSLGFMCTVALCSQVNNADCQQKICTEFSSTAAAPAPAPAAPDDGNITAAATTPGAVKRKRDTANTPKETTVGANTVKVVAPGQQQDSSPSDTGEVRGQNSVTQSCEADQQFTAAVAILGVCVFLLLVLSGCLIFRLMRSKKSDPERPDHYPRPVEGLRFPRLELNNGRDNGI